MTNYALSSQNYHILSVSDFWRSLATFGGHWRLLEVIGDFWRSLATFGGHWRLLEVIGDFWRRQTTKKSPCISNDEGRSRHEECEGEWGLPRDPSLTEGHHY